MFCPFLKLRSNPRLEGASELPWLTEGGGGGWHNIYARVSFSLSLSSSFFLLR
jgi:hypothetical protein